MTGRNLHLWREAVNYFALGEVVTRLDRIGIEIFREGWGQIFQIDKSFPHISRLSRLRYWMASEI